MALEQERAANLQKCHLRSGERSFLLRAGRRPAPRQSSGMGRPPPGASVGPRGRRRRCPQLQSPKMTLMRQSSGKTPPPRRASLPSAERRSTSSWPQHFLLEVGTATAQVVLKEPPVRSTAAAVARRPSARSPAGARRRAAPRARPRRGRLPSSLQRRDPMQSEERPVESRRTSHKPAGRVPAPCLGTCPAAIRPHQASRGCDARRLHE